jgi:hypothetical protein
MDQSTPCLQLFNFMGSIRAAGGVIDFFYKESIRSVGSIIGFFNIEAEHLQEGIIR